MEKSLGQHLQNWLIRNKIDIVHDLFVPAVDLALENELRKIAERRIAATRRRCHKSLHQCASINSYIWLRHGVIPNGRDGTS